MNKILTAACLVAASVCMIFGLVCEGVSITVAITAVGAPFVAGMSVGIAVLDRPEPCRVPARRPPR